MTEEFKLTPKPKRKNRTKTWERWLGIAAIVTIVVAWFIGYAQANAEIESFLYQAMPNASRIEKINGDTWTAYTTNSPEELAGYITIGEASGYGGPMKVAVATDLDGNVLGLSVAEQRETPSWFKRVADSDYIEKLFGKSYTDAFELGNDIDGVTGATYTSRAIADAVRQGSRRIAGQTLGAADVPPEPTPAIQFGIPEIVLIALFAVGYVGHQRKFKYTKQARWVSMLTGMIVLGFIYTNPLTVAYINKFLLGFWPDWHTHLYWYLLIGGIVLVFTVDNKNPYCSWFCPFGAAQECMGIIGGAKNRTPMQYRTTFKWLQRGLAWLAIVVALLFRNPGISSYEVFGTLFDLHGNVTQFALLGLVLLAALFIKRPWCSYLCPLNPIEEFIRMIRGWIKELWLKAKTKPAG